MYCTVASQEEQEEQEERQAKQPQLDFFQYFHGDETGWSLWPDSFRAGGTAQRSKLLAALRERYQLRGSKCRSKFDVEADNALDLLLGSIRQAAVRGKPYLLFPAKESFSDTAVSWRNFELMRDKLVNDGSLYIARKGSWQKDNKGFKTVYGVSDVVVHELMDELLVEESNFDYADIRTPWRALSYDAQQRFKRGYKGKRPAQDMHEDSEWNKIFQQSARYQAGKRVEDETILGNLRMINRAAISHRWVERVDGVDKLVHPYKLIARRHYSETLELGGRFTSAVQSTPSIFRNSFLTGGERTVEADFVAAQPTLLYHLVGEDAPDDPYQIFASTDNAEENERLRNCAKKSFMVGVNSHHPSAARHAALNSVAAKRSTPDGLPTKKFPFKCSDEAMYFLHLWANHEFFGKYMYSCVARKLQNIDSTIMQDILLTLAACGVPVIGIHDSVRCKESDLGVVRDVMRDCHWQHMRKNPRIEVK